MSKPEPKNEIREEQTAMPEHEDANEDASESFADEALPLEEGMEENAEGQAIQDRIVTLEEELAVTKDQALRALAEAENTRRRAIKDREDASKYAVSAFAKDLLDFADNFSRALSAMPEGDEATSEQIKGIIDGIRAMDKELLKTLEKHGITKIEPMDEKFDPNFHEVMFEAPVPGKPAGMIIELIEPGYILHGRLLRPARVGVVKDDGSDEGQAKVDTHA